jgi:hypothetical protein
MVSYHSYDLWRAEVARRGLEVENNGTGRLVAHRDGEEIGEFAPRYGGAGHGWLAA